MIVVMKKNAHQEDVQRVVEYIEQAGLRPHLSDGSTHTIIGVIGAREAIDVLALEALPGVEKAVPVSSGLNLVSRDVKESNTIVTVGDAQIGGTELAVMAGPCAVESKEQLREAALAVKAGGAQFLRGGAYKPRTSPYAFQGLEEQGLKFLAEVSQEVGLQVVTEVVDVESLDLVSNYADMLQIGARNMQNFKLLQAVGKKGKPVLLKRGLSATIEEWLQASEYILREGNFQLVLCERGIRTFEPFTRNTLDLSAVAAAKMLSHLPVIVDPSHATGKWNLVAPMARAAIAAGADGLMVEVHPEPARALCDGNQSLTPKNFNLLMDEVRSFAGLMGRSLS